MADPEQALPLQKHPSPLSIPKTGRVHTRQISGHDLPWSPRPDPKEFLLVDECQKILHSSRPTIVPTFTNLRRLCLTQTATKLRALEADIAALPAGTAKDAAIENATRLLADFDRQFDTAIERFRLEDPEYADARGMAVYNFSAKQGPKAGDWTMVARTLNPDANAIIASSPPKDSLHESWLREFYDSNGQLPEVIAFKRQKSLLERQWRALEVHPASGLLVPNRNMILLWRVLLILGFVCLWGFLGVGIIATTTTFAPTFIKAFFWVAIVWTMTSSTLLTLLVRAMGGNGRDCVGACLAAVAIWLVIIQIGQTKLAAQTAGQGEG